jgi:hypothetical protein
MQHEAGNGDGAGGVRVLAAGKKVTWDAFRCGVEGPHLRCETLYQAIFGTLRTTRTSPGIYVMAPLPYYEPAK